MKIGPLQIDTPIILAPMAGITDLPYRRLMKRFGAGLVFTEMVSANGLIRDGRRTRELLRSAPEERPLGVQLFGDDPEVLASAASLIGNDGDLLDLNLGCPVRKVIRSGAGCALLRNPLKVAEVVAAVRGATTLPLTVKIRSGWDGDSINFIEIARIAQEQGADAVTLHPRTRAQEFSGRADWNHIRQLKESLDIPVIGSGDIVTAADALNMLRQTGCDAVMIGRGGFGNPWLIAEIRHLLTGRKFHPPTAAEKGETARLHLKLFLETFGPRKALLDMRKHLAWYSRGMPGAAPFRGAVNKAGSLDEVSEMIDNFFTLSTAA